MTDTKHSNENGKDDGSENCETLDLVLPDWASLDTQLRSKLPFILWEIGDQPLLYHWLDHAVNNRYESIRLFCADRPDKVRRAMRDATLWPLRWEVLPVTSGGEPEGALRVTGLPACNEESFSPADGWGLLDFWFETERRWFDSAFTDSDAPVNLAIGRNCHIHPSAKLTIPCFIGDNVQIGAGCEIGPYASIGSGSMLAGGNLAAHSRIAKRTFLGPNTGLEHCYLEGGLLLNLKYRGIVPKVDGFVADGWTRGAQKPGWPERLEAMWLWTRFKLRDLMRRPGGKFARMRTFRGTSVPMYCGAPLWKKRMPQLLEAARGKTFLYGVAPRTREQFEGLGHDWQDLLNTAPVGVFSYADTHGCHTPDDEMEAVHAVFQATHPADSLVPACREFVARLLTQNDHNECEQNPNRMTVAEPDKALS